MAMVESSQPLYPLQPYQIIMIKLFGFYSMCGGPGVCSQKDAGFFRTVSFADQVDVAEIPNKKSISKRQRKALWYPAPKRPSRQFKKVQQIFCGAKPEYNGDGDEVNPESSEERENNPIFPISAVLTEQESQRDDGSSIDPAMIAKVYSQCSAHSVVRAQIRALENEMDAQEYMSEPSRHGKKKIFLVEEHII